jgi:RNA polymerase sigma-70 factor (ECF subfamily)
MHSVFIRHIERLRRLVVGMGLSAEDGEDILQDVYIEAVKRPPNARSDRQVRQWLMRVTVNKSLLEFRRRKRHRRAAVTILQQWNELEQSASWPEKQAIRAEEIKAMMQCLSEMNESIQIPLLMKYFCGLNSNEIGEILELEPGTARKRLYDGRILLARALQRKGIKL